MTTLFCGPWVGEFGWEIIWQGICRKKSGKFDNTIVSSFRFSEGLYSDFCSEFISHQFTGERNMTYMEGVNRKTINKFARQNTTILNPYDYMEVIRTGNTDDIGEYIIPSSTKTSEEFDIVIHARHRGGKTQYRNWSADQWGELIDKLKEFKIVAIGSSDSLCPKGVTNKQNISIPEVAGYIKSSRLVVGPSSGPMHLASLCNAPIVTWTENKPQVAKRYLEKWNFHNSKVRIVCQTNNPSIDMVYEAIIDEI